MNAPIKNELEVPDGWLLNSVYRRKFNFVRHMKKHYSLEKGLPKDKYLAKDLEADREGDGKIASPKGLLILHE